MPYYMHQWVYQNNTFRRMIRGSENQNREEVVRLAIEVLGGKLLSFYFCFGEYDGMCVSEFADNETAEACLITVLAHGAVSRIRTTPLFTQDQVSRSIEKAVEVFKPADGGGSTGRGES